MVTASDRAVAAFHLSGGNHHDAPEGEALLDKFERLDGRDYMLMDRAYEGDKMRAKAVEKGFTPVVPPKKNPKKPSLGLRPERHRQRNGIERSFPRLKRFRKIFTRYDKLEAVFCGFILFALVIDAIIKYL